MTIFEIMAGLYSLNFMWHYQNKVIDFVRGIQKRYEYGTKFFNAANDLMDQDSVVIPIGETQLVLTVNYPDEKRPIGFNTSTKEAECK